MFLGQRKEHLHQIRKKIKLKPVFKFYFNKDDQPHCFVRTQIVNDFNESIIFHFLMIQKDNIWKSTSLMEQGEFKYVNRLMTSFKSEYIKELFNDSSPKSDVLINLKKSIATLKDSTQFKIYEFNKNGRKVKKEFEPFVFEQNTFSSKWFYTQIQDNK